MRPRKIILLIDPLEDRQSVTRMVLEIKGYCVLSASSLFAAGRFLADGACPDLLLGYSPISEKVFAKMSYEPRRHAIFMAPKDNGTENCCDATLDVYWTPMSELLDRIKILSARKRGPMKGMKRPPATIQPAPVEACA